MREVLTLLTWPDYISPATIRQFGKETGIDVELEIVPSAVELVERMRQPGLPPDVLCPPDYAVRELSVAGLLYELDKSRLPNLKNIEARFASGRPHDPDSRVSVVKDWGTTGFMYRTDVINGAPGTWADFWALASQHSGKVTVLDSPGEVIGAALKMRGHSYNSVDPAALDQARTDLGELARHLLAFDTDYRPRIKSGEAVLALGWNGDAAALAASGLPVAYVVPNEGSQVWEDDWAIAAGTDQPESSHLFLNFVLRHDVAAQEARYTGYATGNAAGYNLLDKKIVSNPSTYPPSDILSRLEPGLPLDDNGSARRKELWSAVRGGVL